MDQTPQLWPWSDSDGMVEKSDGYGSPITKKDDHYLNPSSQHDSECEW